MTSTACDDQLKPDDSEASRDALLGTLAMTLQCWPKNIGEAKHLVGESVLNSGWRIVVDAYDVYFLSPDEKHHIRPEHYHDRRRELINKPDHSDAPEWAECIAQLSGGEWRAYSKHPLMTRGDDWVFDSMANLRRETISVGACPSGHDWRETLERVEREVVREFNPPTSCLTDSQQRELSAQQGLCSDDIECGKDSKSHLYCGECPSAPHLKDAECLDAQLAEAMDIEEPYTETDAINDLDGRIGGGDFVADMVNPAHYKHGEIECIDAIKAATINKKGIEAACTANVIKYLWRYESKNGVEDIKKARWYLERLLLELGNK